MSQELALQDVLADAADGLKSLAMPGNALQAAARYLAVATFTDSQWWKVEAALRQMASDASVTAILARQRDAMAGITNTVQSGDANRMRPAHPSAAEIEEAQADFRSHLPEVAERLPEVEEVASKITADPEKRGAIERIVKIVRDSTASMLPPLGLLIVLWWLFVMRMPKDAAGTDVAVLALWYIIARDTWRKD